jgi:hypothetical protein
MPLGFVWVLERRAVLVHAPEFDVAALCRLRIGYDLVFNQPSLSTRIDPVMSGLGNEPHMLMLSIAPKAVDTCTVGSNICYSVIPARMINMLPWSDRFSRCADFDTVPQRFQKQSRSQRPSSSERTPSECSSCER